MDLRASLNAVSEVVSNRPQPLREFDQIYMKSADMLLQAEHVSRVLAGRDVVFIGDGDAIALTAVHLYRQGLLETGPKRVHVLDFDERIVRSIENFRDQFGLEQWVSANLYNVVDPVPDSYLNRFNAFHINPPYGRSNDGLSVRVFLERAIEATGGDVVGCAVIADHDDYSWSRRVIFNTQKMMIERGFIVAEMIPRFHTYHLGEAPDLTSCSIAFRRASEDPYAKRLSKALTDEELKRFYGKDGTLAVQYVKDLTGGGKFVSRDHKLEPLDRAPRLFREQ